MFLIIQVDFDEDTAHSMLDRKGFMTRESFFEFAISTKLVDFLEKKEAPTPKKQQMMPPRYTTKVWILHIQYPYMTMFAEDQVQERTLLLRKAFY